MDKIRLTEADLHRIVKESVNCHQHKGLVACGMRKSCSHMYLHVWVVDTHPAT